MADVDRHTRAGQAPETAGSDPAPGRCSRLPRPRVSCWTTSTLNPASRSAAAADARSAFVTSGHLDVLRPARDGERDPRAWRRRSSMPAGPGRSPCRRACRCRRPAAARRSLPTGAAPSPMSYDWPTTDGIGDRLRALGDVDPHLGVDRHDRARRGGLCDHRVRCPVRSGTWTRASPSGPPAPSAATASASVLPRTSGTLTSGLPPTRPGGRRSGPSRAWPRDRAPARRRVPCRRRRSCTR